MDWYTGSAGWMYRLIVESLLGLKLEGDKLHIAPCLPAEWNEFKLTYRYRATEYGITVKRSEVDDESADGTSVTVDGALQDTAYILLIDDSQPHEVEVRVRTASVTSAPVLAS